jgi:hypothetical protein
LEALETHGASLETFEAHRNDCMYSSKSANAP